MGDLVDFLAGVISDVGSVALWLQTLGVILVIWIIFQVIGLVINRRRIKEIYTIKKDMIRIEKKIDRILKSTENKKR